MVGLFSVVMSAGPSSLVRAKMQRVSSSLMEGLIPCAIRKSVVMAERRRMPSSVNIAVRESLQTMYNYRHS